jgi:hypothetical protein
MTDRTRSGPTGPARDADALIRPYTEQDYPACRSALG